MRHRPDKSARRSPATSPAQYLAKGCAFHAKLDLRSTYASNSLAAGGVRGPSKSSRLTAQPGTFRRGLGKTGAGTRTVWRRRKQTVAGGPLSAPDRIRTCDLRFRRPRQPRLRVTTQPGSSARKPAPRAGLRPMGPDRQADPDRGDSRSFGPGLVHGRCVVSNFHRERRLTLSTLKPRTAAEAGGATHREDPVP